MGCLAELHWPFYPIPGDLETAMGPWGSRIVLDKSGLWYKRLEAGTFRQPRGPADRASVELKASELAMLLEGIDLRSVKRTPRLRLGGKTV